MDDATYCEAREPILELHILERSRYYRLATFLTFSHGQIFETAKRGRQSYTVNDGWAFQLGENCYRGIPTVFGVVFLQRKFYNHKKCTTLFPYEYDETITES